VCDVGIDSDHFRDNHMDQKLGKVRRIPSYMLLIQYKHPIPWKTYTDENDSPAPSRKQ
jgi:hypothetical protein